MPPDYRMHQRSEAEHDHPNSNSYGDRQLKGEGQILANASANLSSIPQLLGAYDEG